MTSVCVFVDLLLICDYSGKHTLWGKHNAFCNNCGSRVPRQTARGWILAPLGSTMKLPDIKPTLVCPEDHTDWFNNLEEILKKGK